MFTDMALMLRSTDGQEVKGEEKKTKLVPDFQGRKPIHVSAGYGQVSFVQQLLEVIHLTQTIVLSLGPFTMFSSLLGATHLSFV